MTPAEHYAEAERLLEALRAEQVSTGNAQAHKAPLTFALAQVHATLAMVPSFPTKWIGPDVKQVMRPDGTIEQCSCPVDAAHIGGTDPACICPRHDHEPFARLATFPACPIHGGA